MDFDGIEDNAVAILEFLLGVDAGAVEASEELLHLGLDAVALAHKIRELGARSVIVKLGDQGCVYCGPDRTFATPPFAVRAVDSTAAGDTFNAALAVSLAEGAEMEDALRFANAAAAISVTRAGAQTSAPSRAEVESLLAQMRP